MIIPSRFGGRLLSVLRLQKPLDETLQSFVQPCGWPVTEQFSRLGNVRASDMHIAGLLWQLVDLRFFPKHIFDCNDQVFQLDRLALTQIKDIEERAFVLKRGNRSLNDIINESVITSRGAVAKLFDWLAGINAPGELMNRQVRPLPRTVHSEVTERYYAEPVKMRVSRAEKLAGNLRRGIRAQCLSQVLILRKGYGFRSTVDRRTG